MSTANGIQPASASGVSLQSSILRTAASTAERTVDTPSAIARGPLSLPKVPSFRRRIHGASAENVGTRGGRLTTTPLGIVTRGLELELVLERGVSTIGLQPHSGRYFANLTPRKIYSRAGGKPLTSISTRRAGLRAWLLMLARIAGLLVIKGSPQDRSLKSVRKRWPV